MIMGNSRVILNIEQWICCKHPCEHFNLVELGGDVQVSLVGCHA